LELLFLIQLMLLESLEISVKLVTTAQALQP